MFGHEGSGCLVLSCQDSVKHSIRSNRVAMIVESISVVDGLGLPKRPFKKKLLKYDYRIETPSFESAQGKFL